MSLIKEYLNRKLYLIPNSLELNFTDIWENLRNETNESTDNENIFTCTKIVKKVKFEEGKVIVKSGKNKKILKVKKIKKVYFYNCKEIYCKKSFSTQKYLKKHESVHFQIKILKLFESENNLMSKEEINLN